MSCNFEVFKSKTFFSGYDEDFEKIETLYAIEFYNECIDLIKQLIEEATQRECSNQFIDVIIDTNGNFTVGGQWNRSDRWRNYINDANVVKNVCYILKIRNENEHHYTKSTKDEAFNSMQTLVDFFVIISKKHKYKISSFNIIEPDAIDIDNAEKIKAQSQQKLDDANKEIIQLKKEQKALEKEIDKISKANSKDKNASKELNDLNDKHQKTIDQLKVLIEKKAAIEDELSTIKKDLKKLKEENKTLQTNYETVKTENENLKSKTEQLEQELTQKARIIKPLTTEWVEEL